MGLKSRIKRVLRPGRAVEVLPTSQDKVMAGRRVLVTGGTSGIGRAAVELLVRCGAEVAFTGRPGNRELAEIEAELGGAAHGIEYDAGERPADDLLERAADVLGGSPDCLFANAGVYTDGEGVWDACSVDRVLRVNLMATTELVNAFVARLVVGGRHGTIVATGSNRGLMPDSVPYGLSKVALHTFIQGVAREHYRDGIRANVVAPGMTASNINGVDPDGDLAKDFETIGEGRVIRPEEIAEVVLFLLSDRSLCINGAVVPCDLGDSLR